MIKISTKSAAKSNNTQLSLTDLNAEYLGAVGTVPTFDFTIGLHVFEFQTCVYIGLACWQETRFCFCKFCQNLWKGHFLVSTPVLVFQLRYWPPLCVIKFTTCCWQLRSKAFRNLRHCSSDVSRSSTAAFLLYAALLSLRTSSYSLRVSTSSLSSSSSSSKSGSIMSASRLFRLLMAEKKNRVRYLHQVSQHIDKNVWSSVWCIKQQHHSV